MTKSSAREVKREIIKKEGEHFDLNLAGLKGAIHFTFKPVCTIRAALMSEKGDSTLETESVPVKPAVSAQRARRSSLFEVGFPVQRDRGSSIVSIPSIVPSHLHTLHQKVTFENTFKMEPDTRFHIGEVKEILDEMLSSSLKDVKYDAIKCRALSKSLSHTICERVKLLGFTRFKIISSVSIGQIKGQDLRIASRFLWDEKHDSWVDAVFTNSEIFAVAVVYGIYQE